MTAETKILNLRNLMQEIVFDLENIDFDNFDDRFPVVKNKAVNVKKMRFELENEITSNLYKKNQKDLLFLAKQIKIKYDNLIKIREDESAAISAELKSLMNSKKIANYKR